MSNSIEEFRMREKIKIASLKYRGNINDIVEETGLDAEYVRKQLEKIKKQRDSNVSILISQTLMQYLFEGHQNRIVYIDEMLKSLKNTESIEVSDCCKMPVKVEKNSDGTEDIKCRSCSSDCKVILLKQQDMYNLKIKLLNELQKEDASLVDFATKMGYTNAIPVERAPIIKQEFLVVGNGNKDKKQVTADDVLTMEMINNMPPAEREKLRKQLEHRIIEFSKSNEVTETKVEIVK